MFTFGSLAMLTFWLNNFIWAVTTRRSDENNLLPHCCFTVRQWNSCISASGSDGSQELVCVRSWSVGPKPHHEIGDYENIWSHGGCTQMECQAVCSVDSSSIAEYEKESVQHSPCNTVTHCKWEGDFYLECLWFLMNGKEPRAASVIGMGASLCTDFEDKTGRISLSVSQPSVILWLCSPCF